MWMTSSLSNVPDVPNVPHVVNFSNGAISPIATLPIVSNGYLCSGTIFTKEYSDKTALKAHQKLRNQKPRSKFPALLDDTHFFGQTGDNLYLWPQGRPDSNFDSKFISQYRVVIDSSGSLKGILKAIEPDISATPVTYEKCMEVHITLDSSSLNVYKDDRYKQIGFSCDHKFIKLSEVMSVMEEQCHLIPLKKSHPKLTKNLHRYKGKSFSTPRLLSSKLKGKTRVRSSTGQFGICQVVFSSLCHLQGVILRHGKDKEEIVCSRVWALKQQPAISSEEHPLNTNDGIIKDYRKQYSCQGRTFMRKTIMNYISEGRRILSEPQQRGNKFPFLYNKNLWLWPMRLPEMFKTDGSKLDFFMVGFNLDKSYRSIYFASKGSLSKIEPKKCHNSSLLEKNFFLASFGAVLYQQMLKDYPSWVEQPDRKISSSKKLKNI
ncbi:putative effector protein [Blumeria hordei DH14]|uniref:Putative effector protein n=1 Tax=Blumeria graminis f. sp. hordei (strain DH14) TaxID=546991 RepID=N1J796_BLUG1|nr:putative effector protein [Blumeria hordei DH14]